MGGEHKHAALWRLRQSDPDSQHSMGYIARPRLRRRNKTSKQIKKKNKNLRLWDNTDAEEC